MNIREEQPSDVEKIWKVNSEVFETEAEANLVNALRGSGCAYISLVAETEHNVVGHILFTSVKYGINSEYEVPDEVFMILKLAPESLKNYAGVITYHDVFNNL